MNQQIKQLANEAGFMDSWFSESGDDCERELKKFAELIVRECVQACINMGNDYEIKSAGQYQAELFAFAIKKHFGVEE